MRFRSLLIGWTLLALVGWLIAAGSLADREAGCNPEYELVCFDEGAIWLMTAAVMAGIWIFGALLLGIVVFVARTWGQSRRR